MRVLALDPTTGDLAISSGQMSMLSDADAVAQQLRGRLSLVRGSWFLDLTAGIPYLELLTRKGVEALLSAELRAAAETSPGVDAITSFTLTRNPTTREASVSLVARAGKQEITLDAYRVAGEL